MLLEAPINNLDYTKLEGNIKDKDLERFSFRVGACWLYGHAVWIRDESKFDSCLPDNINTHWLILENINVNNKK